MQMQCDEARGLMPLYLSGEIEAPSRELLESHVDVCPPCRRELDAQRELDGELRRAMLAEALPTAGLVARFRGEIAPRRRWVRWGVAAAVLIGVLAGGLTYWRAAVRPMADVYAAALRDHHRELIEKQPRRWMDDLASIENLALEQGVAARMLAQLAPAGYRLEHGKLCRLNGRAYLHLVYESRGEQVSLFLRGGDVPAPPTHAEQRDGKFLYSAGSGGEHVAGVQNGALSVVYVTGEADEASRFAEQAAAVL